MEIANPLSQCPRCAGAIFDVDGPVPDSAAPVCLLDGEHYECKLCTCTVTDHYSCYQFPRVVPDPEATPLQLAGAKLDCKERRRRMAESVTSADVHSPQELSWLIDTARVAKLVAKGNADLSPVFWIRLYGVLNEMYGRLAASHESSLRIGANPHLGIVRFLEEVSVLYAHFSDDELLYIQYRRDVECHPLQFNYERTVNKKGSARGSFKHKIFQKDAPVTLEDFSAAIKRVLSSAPNEVVLAQSFADRCWSTLETLQEKGRYIYG